jgi:hypothetical protein
MMNVYADFSIQFCNSVRGLKQKQSVLLGAEVLLSVDTGRKRCCKQNFSFFGWELKLSTFVWLQIPPRETEFVWGTSWEFYVLMGALVTVPPVDQDVAKF